MTPTDIVSAARDLYNGTNDTFFTDTQMYNWIWQAEKELAKKAWLIEKHYQASTVAATQGYTYPTYAIGVKRIAVNGRKLKEITFRQDDAITLSNQTITSQGWPIYYTDFNFTIYMRPIPDSIYTIDLYTYNDAQPVSASSTIEVPALFHFDIVDYLLFRMYFKDQNIASAEEHKTLWQGHVVDAVAYKNRKKRTDSFATVQSEEVLPVTILGEA